MALSTTPELLKELATLYRRIAELEHAGGLRPGEGAPSGLHQADDLEAGLHAPVAAFSSDAVGVLTPAGEVLHVNDAVERLFGYRADELVGRNAWSYVHEEDLAAMASARSAPLDDGLPVEVRVRCADGALRRCEFSARAWPSDAPRYIVARWRAVAPPGPELPGVDAQRLADELRRAAALARITQLALGLPHPSDVLDASVALAPAALALPLGAYLEPGEDGFRVRADTGFPSGIRERPVPLVMTAAGLAQAGGAPVRVFDLGRDGRLADPLLESAGASCAVAVPVRGKERAHGVLVAAGRRVRHFLPEEVHFLETVANVLATALDARAAQDALRARERLARAVFDQARDGMAIVDAEGRCVELNAAAERVLGASFDALRGRRPADVAGVALDLRPQIGSTRHGDAVVSSAGGARMIEADVVPEIVPGLALAVVRDVTERQEMVNRLALADRLISVGTLAAGVAHELNTPLAYVSANLRYLSAAMAEKGTLAGAEAEEALREAVDGVDRLRTTLDDLRSFVRSPAADAGSAELESVLRSAIAMTWNDVRLRARLERDLAPVPPVAGNPSRLAQVFVNLLVNAAQAIPESDPERHVIKISTRPAADGQVEVEVSDTGCGITAAVLPHIFEPFFTTKPPHVGTGLGLSIARSIVHGLGGAIEVASQAGRGSTFRVLLPVAGGSRPAT